MFDLTVLKNSHQKVLGGVDEVGRGPLAGPVVACAVSLEGMNKEEALKLLDDLGVTDSKKISSIRRKKILESLGIDLKKLKKGQVLTFGKNKNYTLRYCIQEKSPLKIDQLNILHASLSAMVMSWNKIYLDKEKKFYLLVDGNQLPDCWKNSKSVKSVVKGDTKSLIIGIASIIAKEYRDQLMKKMAKKYPGYGFEKHAGYPTKMHKKMIRELGVCPIHRKSFKGVKEYL